ncbi:protein zerknuellt 2-like [Vanessa cardui]|uniref:protein zerknuellt 2-like n=1 Tax=Vanessa cardui TaxID=171605 RepID=UPI001F12FB1C|nr:protein zerknuellt 2-like [Vanessa cardui]
MFTTEQIIALEEVFNKRPYINREERMAMMEKLQISEKSIKVWFQNRRRLTDKRSKDYRSDSLSSEDMSDTFLDRLTTIESSINQRTDKYGLVRLDNGTMNELVNVINEYLSQDIEHTQPIVNETKVIYEPISPVSLSENSEDIYVTPQLESLSSDQVTDLESLLFF